jgi:amino acid adenylation domain-containing protein
MSANEDRDALKRELLLLRLKRAGASRSEESAAPTIGRADRSAPLPLSWPQQQLWFLQQLQPDASTAYHLPVALRLEGRPDKVALHATLDRLLERHEVLRTHFASIDGKPVQVIEESQSRSFALVEYDLQGRSAGERDDAVQWHRQSEQQALFDLEHGPLIRGRLLQLEDELHVLLVTQHHIVTDGWSIQLLVKEFTALYAALSAGLPDPLPPLALQYADYAAWQRGWLHGEELQRQLGYWKEQLQGAPPLLPLPTDRPRPQTMQHGSASATFPLSKELVDQLRALSQRHGVTLFMTCLAAWSILLSRLSGEDDVVIGTPVANRQLSEVEPLIGYFVNMLALRIPLSGDSTVAELLAQVKSITLDAYAHQSVPFEQVVDAVQPTRSLAHNAIYQVGLALNRYSELTSLNLPGLRMAALETPRTATHFDLLLTLNETADGADGVIEYSTALFDACSIDAYAAQLTTLLSAMATGDALALHELSTLDPAGRLRVLEQFQPDAVVFDGDRLLHQHFEAQAQLRPDAVALVFGERTMSYDALNRAANRLAHRLIALGVRPDDRVAVCAERSIETMVGLLAVLKSGATYMPVDPEYPAERKVFMARDGQPVAWLTQTPWRDEVPVGTPCLLLDLSQDEPGIEDNPDPVALGLHARHLAYVIYTSGSTGQPKGVGVEHRSVGNLLLLRTADAQSRVLQFSSLSFDVSVYEIFMALCHGAALYLIDRETMRDGERLVRAIDAHGITHANLPPALLAVLPDDVRLPSVSTLIIGGEKSSSELAARWAVGRRLLNAYGPTEATVCATIHPCREDEAGELPIGRPTPNTRIYILDARQQPVPPGCVGEIVIGGPGVARGYLNRSELSSQHFLADPFASEQGARMYRTGDLARWLRHGDIQYVGRRDKQVKVRGFRVELGEIESCLAALPGVRQAVVDTQEEGAGAQRLVAYLATGQGRQVELWPSVAEYFIYDDLLYHLMSSDEHRMHAYRQAIGLAVKGKVVLEIGSGQDAILAQLCVEAGARKVYSVELLEEMYVKAKTVIERLGLTDRIELIHGDITKVELPELADVCVSALVGPIGGTEGVSFLLNSARRLLKPDCVMVPARATTRMAAVSLPDAFRAEPGFTEISSGYVDKIFAACGYRFDLRLCLRGMNKGDLVSTLGVFEDLDHATATATEGRRHERMTVTRDARMDGLLVWLNLHTAPGIAIDILDREHCWLPVYLPVFHPSVMVREGEVIEVTVDTSLCSNGVNPDYRLHGRLLRNDGSVLPFSYDSLHYEPVYRKHAFYDAIFADDRPVIAAERPRQTSEEWRAQLRSVLPDYMVPSSIVQLDQLPITPHGKVDRRKLRENHRPLVSADFEAPRGVTERALAQIWQLLLGATRVGRADHFFEAGGHSLLAVQLISRVRQELRRDIALRDLFANPTLASFAHALDKAADMEGVLPIGTAVRSQALPLSWSQQRLWFLDRFDPAASKVYHIPVALRLRGALDSRALRAALDRIVARHEILRTRFEQPRGNAEPVQQIGPEQQGFALIEHDLAMLTPGERASALDRLQQAEREQGFDLARGPLIRGSLVRIAEQEHLLLIAQHHIISDAWSIGVLIREFCALYRAFVQGAPDALPPLAVQYADYALWQRQWLQGPVLAEQVAYWKNHLSGAPPLLSLPSDRPRPARQSYAGGTYPLQLPAELVASLRQVGHAAGVTLYMLLLAAWATLLGRLSGQDEVVIGLPVANRQRREIEGCIGFFVNTLAVRVPWAAGTSVRDLLATVKECLLGAYAHQDLPFEQVVEALNPPRNANHSPIFQASLTLNQIDGDALQLPGLDIESLPSEHHATYVDVSLLLTESGDQIGGEFKFAKDLYDADTIGRWAEHWLQLLRVFAELPSKAPTHLPLLDPAGQRRWLDSVNATFSEAPGASRIHALFEAQAAHTPDAAALAYCDEVLSYRELNERANRLAHALMAMGAGDGALIGVCADRGFALIVGLLAIWKAGCAYLPIDPEYPSERLAYMLEDSALAMALVTEGLQDRLDACGWHGIQMAMDDGGQSPLWANQAAANPGGDRQSSELAYVIYTSGSSGLPKGTLIEHPGLCNLAAAQGALFELQPSSRVLQFASPNFDASLWEIVMALCHGACLCLAPIDALRPGKPLAATLATHAVTHVTLPASALAVMQDSWASSLSVVIAAGDSCPPEIARQWSSRCRFFNAYGPTETTVCASVHACTVDEQGIVPIGRPIANTQMYVLDAHGEPAPIGVAGELVIGGVGVARGYLNRPELTAERFVEDRFGEPGGRLYRTGDLGRWRADGVIEFLGRNDHQVKLRGFRIELGEIEAALLACEGIREAVVVAREDVPGDKRLVAYVVGDEACSKASVLREQLSQRLADYMVPAAYVQLHAMPLSSNGKLDRNALPAPDGSSVATQTYEAPQGEIETTLAALWQELLGLEQVGRHDQFFELGGHSLLAVQLIGRLKELFLVDVPVKELFDHPVLCRLADVIVTLQLDAYACESAGDIDAELEGLTEDELRNLLLEGVDK